MSPRRKLPTHITNETTVSEAIEFAFNTFADLSQEVLEVVDNCPENLRSSERIETLEEIGTTLEGLTQPDVPQLIAEAEVTWLEPRVTDRRRGHSRAVRRDIAVIALCAVHLAATDASQDPSNAREIRDDCRAFAEAITETIDAVEGLDFPSGRG